jgi:hypothetical protein
MDACELAMRDGDAIADTGRTEALALQNNVENFDALADNSCKSCFLEFTLRPGMIAFCCSKSANAISFSFCAETWGSGSWPAAPPLDLSL